MAIKSAKQKLIDRLHHKFRLVVVDDDTLEEQLSVRLSQMNLYVFISTLLVLMAALTAFVIIATPLKEYIPGYDDTGTRRKVYQLSVKSDSLERVVKQQNTFINNVKSVLSDETGAGIAGTNLQNTPDTGTVAAVHTNLDEVSEEEMELRHNLEQETQFAIIGDENLNAQQLRNTQIVNLFAPVKGVISATFDAGKAHYGIDINTAEKEPVKAAAPGMVVMAEWTIDTGYVIAIQHTDNLVTFYKHNSALLKKSGNFVKAGDVIAFTGNSGEQSTGPHLHFELWHNQRPVNPTDFLDFN
ncbi:M23 family peptidase [Sphingobacteriales bacterium UPWRP_1]|nr:hypothetical protein BVG80_15560 [Sphingobacteriales bacterium TSM_CSM]PSJ76435.1 M23 family peptidase [Sphingobacteriales bacterium UPWRP_1]